MTHRCAPAPSDTARHRSSIQLQQLPLHMSATFPPACQLVAHAFRAPTDPALCASTPSLPRYLQLYLLAFALTSLGAAAGASALLMSRLGRRWGLKLMYCLAALPGVVVAQVGGSMAGGGLAVGRQMK